MSVYPETFFEKLFSYLPITNSLSSDVLRCIKDRAALLYMSSLIISLVIAGISVTALVILYLKYKTSISRFLFTCLLLLGGCSLFFVTGGITCSHILGTFKMCGLALLNQYFLCAPFVPFVLVLYLLCRYACGYDEKRIPYLQCTLFFWWLWIMRCLIFWTNNPLARIIMDEKREGRFITFTHHLEIIELSTAHRFISLCFILITVGIVILLYSQLYRKAQLRSPIIAFYYIRLARFASLFLIVWNAINIYLYRIQKVNVTYKIDDPFSLSTYSGPTVLIDAVPLWIKYVVVLLPYVFYATFSIYFVYALYQARQKI